MIFNDLFNEYIAIFKDIHSSSETTNKLNRYKNHIEPLIGSLSIDEIKYKHCQTIVNTVIKVKELSPKTAKNVNAIVQTIFNYAIKNEYTEKNPAQNVIIPAFDNKYNIELSQEQITDLIHNIINYDNEKYKLIFLFALHGRRKTEILQLQKYQIDLTNNVYFIPPKKNKSKKYDVHEMTPLLATQLKKYLSTQDRKINNNDYVFINEDTNNYYKDIRKPFNRLKNQSNIGKMRFHDFRHLLGTESIKKGVPIEHISQALGHSSIEVTQRYITKDASISSQVVGSLLETFIK